ncbi:TDP-fucosamine acetyltransferase [compost metagenome]
MIAVNEQKRGKGVGKFLMRQADRFFKEKQASGATVVTQLDNIPACRLYEKMGYTILKNESIYHYYAKK